MLDMCLDRQLLVRALLRQTFGTVLPEIMPQELQAWERLQLLQSGRAEQQNVRTFRGYWYSLHSKCVGGVCVW